MDIMHVFFVVPFLSLCIFFAPFVLWKYIGIVYDIFKTTFMGK